MQVESNDFLVAGRECGECSACCEMLLINDSALRKAPKVRCPNLSPQGLCGIYESRPDSCRGFFCAWRMAEGLDDGWRPDRSGVLLVVDGKPSEGMGLGWAFHIIAPAEKVAWPALAEVVMQTLQANRVAWMVVSKPDCYPLKASLNESLAPLMAVGNRPAVEQALRQVYSVLLQKPFTPLNWDDLPVAVAGAV